MSECVINLRKFYDNNELMILYPTGLAAMQLSDWILMNHFTPGGCLFYCTTQPLLDCNVDDDDTHLMAIFPTAWVSGYQNVSFLGFIAGNDDNWRYKTCKAPVKLSPSENQHPAFYWPDPFPVAQPCQSTEGKSVAYHRLAQPKLT